MTMHSVNLYNISDIDECEVGTDSCDSNATCNNTIGSFTCVCNEGFSGDGRTCTGERECNFCIKGLKSLKVHTYMKNSLLY